MKRILVTVVIVIAMVLTIWYLFTPIMEKISPQAKPLPTVTSATVLNPTMPFIPFSLTDTSNQPFTQSSLEGHWTLLFFGYAQCPDICPKTLATLGEAWNLLPQVQQPNPIRFVFVSLDPKNDTPEDLQAFLHRFHPTFTGLTGEQSMIDRLGKHCHIYYWQDLNGKAQRKIDHSATLLLIDPQARIKALFSPPYEKEVLVKDLQTLLES